MMKSVNRSLAGRRITRLPWVRRVMVTTAAAVVAVVSAAVPGHAAEPTPAVWIGAPFTGNWPNDDGCGAGETEYSCSLPRIHHTVYRNPVGGYLSDWAADLQDIGDGTPVVLYAAPQDGVTSVSAVVETVAPACGSGDVSQGGHRVTVAISAGSTRVGTVTYGHINPSVTEGQTIDRWGTQLGTVGIYSPNGCWSGVHTHIEMSNQAKFACYNGTWGPGQRMEPTNFIGFIGGNYAAGTKQACP